MNRVTFGETACERTRKYFDSYISSELLIETNHEVLRHLEGCPACAAEVDARTRLRAQLKTAVRKQAVPVEMAVLVRERIRVEGSRKPFGSAWMRWAAATAASLTIGAFAWLQFAPERVPDIGDRPAQTAYIQKISSRMAAVLKVGLGNHMHCSVFRKYSNTPPDAAEMQKQLGPEFQGLLQAVQATAPKDYRVVMAHHCGYMGRKFVHLTMEKDGRLLSLVIARKEEGETLRSLAPATDHAGMPMYQSSAGRYQVAAFDAGKFFAYVVSDAPAHINLQIASSMAHEVRDLLVKLS